MTHATLLLRQIHPDWIVDGRVTSQAFKPTKKDEGRVSTEDGDRTTAEDSYNRYIQNYDSDGVMAVTVQECTDLQLPILSEPNKHSEYHTVIDYGRSTRRQIKDNAGILTAHARRRGWLYQLVELLPQ
jgi:hypothetical protein